MSSLFKRLFGGLRGLVRREREERDLDEELRGFVDAAVEDRIRGGASRDEAVRAARRDAGSLEAVKDRVRDVGWESIAESVWQDVRYGARMLRRSPAFAATAIAMLALGVGANTAIFTLLDGIMLRPLPVRDPDQLVELMSRYPGEPRLHGFSWQVYEHFRDRNHVFSDVIGVRPSRFQVGVDGQEPETVDGELVVGHLFSTLGLEPTIGRLIGPDDTRAGAEPVAVISWPYWKKRFNGDPAALGSHVTVNGAAVAIVGVTPRAFSGLVPGIAAAVWLPVTRPVDLGLMARLKPGVSIGQARADMTVLHRFRIEELAKRSGDPLWLQAKMEIEPAAAGISTLRDRFGRSLLVLMAGVGLVLLIACTNVASILLARGAARRREIAVRVSLGAGRLRLARQVLTESLLLSAAGSLLGIALAYPAAGALLRLLMSGRLPPGYWPQQLAINTAPDGRVLLFTAAVAFATGIFFGLAPAWSAFRSPPITSLREIGTAGERKSRRLFGKGLVVGQVALSVVLLSAAGLFVSHQSNLRNRDLGFQRESVLLVTLNPQGSGYNRAQLTGLYRDLLERLERIPGVRSATLSAVTPIAGGAASRFALVEGHHETAADRRRLHLNWVAPKYFETFGTPLMMGRDFQFEDATRPRVAIVNQAMVRHYFGAANPLGRHLTFEDETLPYEIVGVVGDAKYEDLRAPAPRTVYLAAFQEGRIASAFALRTSVPPGSVAADVRRAAAELVTGIPIAKVTTLTEQLDASIVTERLIALLSSVFGALGTLLAAIGLYGLLAYTVTRRTSEIGVRMALGATERDVIRMVVTGAAGLVGVGLLAGVPVALWSRRFASSVIENLPADTWIPLAVAAATMAVAGLLAAWLPARRAARVRPIDALRHS